MERKDGVLTISLEVELAWGMKEAKDYSCFSSGRKKETKTLRNILDLCDELDIPITFDFVGHLLMGECRGEHYSGHSEGWFDEDPGSNVEEDPLWYAPDLVEMVIDSEVDHEIATHTFSHLWVDEVHPEVLKSELEKVKELHENFGIEKPVSLVTPQNRIPRSYEPLKECGIKVIRKCPEKMRSESKMKLLWNDLFSESPKRSPKIENGVLETYGSCRASLTGNYLPHGKKPPHPLYRMIPVSKNYWIKRHKNRLKEEVDKVVGKGSHVHLWSHLWEMSNRSQIEVFEEFVRYVDEKIKRDELNVKTMRDFLEQD